MEVKKRPTTGKKKGPASRGLEKLQGAIDHHAWEHPKSENRTTGRKGRYF